MEIIKAATEKITQDALIELANSKVYKLLNTCETLEEVKALGLPITLKGMTDNVDVKSGGMPVYLPQEVINKFKLNDNAKTTETLPPVQETTVAIPLQNQES